MPRHLLTCSLLPSVSTLPVQIADPLYGEWLDVYITLLQPLVPPVTGLLGERALQNASIARCLGSGCLAGDGRGQAD